MMCSSAAACQRAARNFEVGSCLFVHWIAPFLDASEYPKLIKAALAVRNLRRKLLRQNLGRAAAFLESSNCTNNTSNSVALRSRVRGILDISVVPPVAELGLLQPNKKTFVS
jgi:hypothetical protein